MVLLKYIPYKNPLFYPLLEVIGAFIAIIIIIHLHNRRVSVDLRNYILLKKLLKIIKSHENENRRGELYHRALEIYSSLSEKRKKKIQKKMDKVGKLINR
mgnify:CR=1 FL=1